MIYVAPIEIFLVHGEEPLALSAVSSHIGHPIAYCRENSTFMEIHGGIWDRSGYYLEGPGTRSMDRVASRVVEGTVEIKVTEVTEGLPRGAGPPERPTGRFCEFEDPGDATNGFLDPPGQQSV